MTVIVLNIELDQDTYGSRTSERGRFNA